MTSQTYISYQNILLKFFFFFNLVCDENYNWVYNTKGKKKKKSVDGIEMWTFINNRWH